MLVVFLHCCLGFVLLIVVTFGFGCFTPIKRWAGKIVPEMTDNSVSGETLSPTQLSSTCW